MFKDGTPSEHIVWGTIVPILKEKGEFQVIGIVKVEWRVCTSFVNSQLKWGIVLHDALHGFRVGYGMGTATLEANLDQKLAGILHEPLFQVCLDIREVYDSLDSG